MTEKDLTERPLGMLGASYAWMCRASPIQWLTPYARSRLGIAVFCSLIRLFQDFGADALLLPLWVVHLPNALGGTAGNVAE